MGAPTDFSQLPASRQRETLQLGYRAEEDGRLTFKTFVSQASRYEGSAFLFSPLRAGVRWELSSGGTHRSSARPRVAPGPRAFVPRSHHRQTARHESYFCWTHTTPIFCQLGSLTQGGV